MNGQKFKLNIRCEIVQLDDHGSWTSNRLSIQDEIGLDLESFFEVAQVLGRFHELAEVIKKERQS